MLPDPPRTLEGWKEIAAYLRVSVRTVQQWEEERALPVRRMGAGRARVWIEVDALRQWRQDLASPPPAVKGRTLSWPAATGAAVVVISAILLLAASSSHGKLGNVVHDGRQLIAPDLEGKVLWSHRFDNVRAIPNGKKLSEGVFADLDEDGETEVLAANPADPVSLASNGLFCFSHSGRLKWQFQPGRAVATAQGVFAPPFHVEKAVPYRSRPGGDWRIAVVSVHATYFPSQVAVLDANGKLLSEYWHAGHLHGMIVADLDHDARPELYTAGLSNGYQNAVVLALDPERMEGAGWEEKPDYQFAGMKPGVEIARWLTPRTPLSRRSIRYNAALDISLSGPGLAATTSEYFPVEELALCLTFGPRLANPAWSQCDIYKTGFARCKSQGLITTQTLESEAAGTTGFRDVTSLRQAAHSSTTDRGATQ
jgi:hypothetical protein